jgi:hypothetical protein
MKIAGVRLWPSLKVPGGRQGRWFKLGCDCHVEEFELLEGEYGCSRLFWIIQRRIEVLRETNAT